MGDIGRFLGAPTGEPPEHRGRTSMFGDGFQVLAATFARVFGDSASSRLTDLGIFRRDYWGKHGLEWNISPLPVIRAAWVQ